MAEEVDSRNAAFKRFRDADQDDSSESLDGSYHKRQRVSTEFAKQGSLPEVLPRDNVEEDNVVTATGHGSSSGTLTRLNWNAGIKTTIGTSFKDRKRADNVHNSGQAASYNDAGQWN